MCRSVIVLLALSLHADAIAGEADVVGVDTGCKAGSGCDSHVTVRRADERFENPDDAVHVGKGRYAR